MVALPSETPVTLPSASTVAMLSSLEVNCAGAAWLSPGLMSHSSWQVPSTDTLGFVHNLVVVDHVTVVVVDAGQFPGHVVET